MLSNNCAKSIVAKVKVMGGEKDGNLNEAKYHQGIKTFYPVCIRKPLENFKHKS